MWAVITSIPALIKMIGEILGLIKSIRRAFQKDPIEEIRKAEEAQKEAADKAEKIDDTDGVFGGGSK